MASSDSSARPVITVDQAIETIGFGRFQIALMSVCGLINAADAIEFMLLSVLGPALTCSWRLSHEEVALITTSVFIGMLLGCPLWGVLADRLGRWSILMITTFMVAYFGLLSSASSTLVWLYILRGIVGFGVGGLVACNSSLFSEFMPSSVRARSMTLMSVCWSIGSLLMAGMAYVILPKLGWRWLVVLAALPMIIALFCFIWLPRSPRYLVVSGNEKKALNILNRIATLNNHPVLNVSLRGNIDDDRGRCNDLFDRRLLRSTFLQWILWFGSGFCYYGIVLVSTELPRVSHLCLQDMSKTSTIALSVNFDNSCCASLTHNTYIAIIVSTIGEFLSLPLNFILLDWWGRRPTLAFHSICAAIMFLCLNFCVPSVGMDILLLMTRTFAHATFTANYVNTTESYPTSVRVLGMGCCSAMARVGAMLSPFVAQVVLPTYSVLGATLIYSGVAILMAISAALLPIETRGRALPQTVEDYSDADKPSDDEKEKEKNYETFKKK